MRRLIFCFLPLMVLATPPAAKSRYLGQPTPAMEPMLFAPGLVSTGLPERDIAIRPDGKEIVFSILGNSEATLVSTKFENGRWTKPEVLPFSRNPEFNDVEPCFTPDGKGLLFLSSRPPEGQAAKPGWQHQNIWKVERDGKGNWGEARMLPKSINDGSPTFFPSLTRKGTLYFCRTDPVKRTTAMFRSVCVNGQYQEAERLPETINGSGPFNACVAPDESCLVFCSGEAKEMLGDVDYFVTIRNSDGSWGEPKNLGPSINGPGRRAGSPAFSPDGRFLFFSSDRLRSDLDKLPKPLSLRTLEKIHQEPENGLTDIYWVDAKVLREMKPKK